jgi:AraC-like DNA-binding protein
MFSRIVRLQAVLRAVRGGSPLADVALGCGFYDQAHMTRDFRQLAAMSPGAWQTHAGDLAPLFVGSSES